MAADRAILGICAYVYMPMEARFLSAPRNDESPFSVYQFLCMFLSRSRAKFGTAFHSRSFSAPLMYTYVDFYLLFHPPKTTILRLNFCMHSSIT